MTELTYAEQLEQQTLEELAEQQEQQISAEIAIELARENFFHHCPDILPLPRANETEHQKYLRSPHWRSYRLKILHRDHYRCTSCNWDEPESLQVHHWTYENKGHERLEDCSTLCRKCHGREHDLD